MGGGDVDAGFPLDEVAGLREEDGKPVKGRIDDPAARQSISTLDLAGHEDLPPLLVPSLVTHVGNRAWFPPPDRGLRVLGRE